jgi:phenylacetate-CoA ligase
MLDRFLTLIHNIRGENVLSAMKELKSLENCDTSSIMAYKMRKLDELLKFVSKHCEFYKNINNNKIVPINHSNILDFLKEIPYISKSDLLKNMDQFICRDIKASWRSTSGTSGVPFIFKKDRYATSYMDAMMYCVYDWHGIKSRDRQARLWGSATKFKDKIIQKTKDFILKRKRISAFSMSDIRCAHYYNVLKKFKPKFFYAYPNAIYRFALSLESQRLDGRDINASVIICTGEILFAYQKEKIQEIFGCKVVNEYGSSENGIIGFECAYGQMHLMPTIYLDILNPDKDGFGELVITELNSRFIPFIKYKNGDIGRLLNAECRCRKPYPIIQIREGRIDDFIVGSNGEIVYDAILAYTLKDFALQFQAVQVSQGALSIHIIPNKQFDASTEKKLRSILKSYLGNDMVINFLIVDKIHPEQSGKLKYFISKLKPTQH